MFDDSAAVVRMSGGFSGTKGSLSGTLRGTEVNPVSSLNRVSSVLNSFLLVMYKSFDTL